MDESSTDALRKLAPSWTLAGDEQLLNILQSTHQKLVSRCQEATTQLERMATALNDASISLQNVNNQFMSLSSSQFIESRVYDDDDLTTEPPAPKESPKQEAPDELTCLKRSISVLEQSHEVITILQDSDSESDTDDDVPARMVLKPKDMYWERPLPYIIGSQPWKNKWHAGLVVEVSDSESSVSDRGEESEQYSHSDTEEHGPPCPPPPPRATVSETSSSLPSEQGSTPRPTPSDVASDLARRLGAQPHKMVERDPEPEEPPQPATRKVYRPQDPVSSTIFSDEPPPLSEHSDSQDSDIFAELHRQTRRTHTLQHQHDDEEDLFTGLGQKPPTTKPSQAPLPVPQRPSQYDDHDDYNDDDGYAGYEHQRQDIRRADTKADDAEVDRGVRKPVGGISLFGNKGTESIGAAILKRNQRKSSTSGDDTETDSHSETQKPQMKKEKDIFDDLFARSEGRKVVKDKSNIVKDLNNEIQKKNKDKDKIVVKTEKPKVDLFSDDLFDDIDDIFSSNITKVPPKDDKKSSKTIFEDDDDLFSEIAPPKPSRIEVATSSAKKSLFDSDDELFADNLQAKADDKPIVKAAEVVKTNVESSRTNKEVTRSIFDDDDDELFNDLKTNKVNDVKVQSDISVSVGKPDDHEKTGKNHQNTSNVFKSPSLFDDDDDDDGDLFAKAVKSSIIVNKEQSSVKTDVNVKPSSSVKIDDFNKNDDLTAVIEVDNNNADDSKSVTKLGNKDLNENVNIDSENVITNSAAKIFDRIQKVESSPESNNDFSDQDFDDLSPKPQKATTNNKITNKNESKPIETESIFDITHALEEELPKPATNNKITHENEPKSKEKESIFDETQTLEEQPPKLATNNNENEPKVKGIENIFDKTMLEEDIDELFTKSQEKYKSEPLFDEPPELNEHKNNTKTEFDNKNEPKTSETDIFNDILTEPPVFEKPKEPKKSKNVNALFDDDSDDESLFFKKNDHVFDDHPNDFTPTQDRIFGLFADEPPDDGFGKISDVDDDMFSNVPKAKVKRENLPSLPVHEIKPSNNDKQTKLVNEEDIFSTVAHVEILKDTKIDDDHRTDDIVDDKPKSNKFEPGKSSFPLVDDDDDDLFKVPEIPKPSVKEIPRLDLSDDEHLFARKPDKKPTIVEKPTPVPVAEKIQKANIKTPVDELFSPEKQEKLKVESEVNLDADSKSDEELFKVTEKKSIPEKNVELSKTSDDELFSSVKPVKLAENITQIQEKDSKLDEDLLFKPKPKPEIVNKPENNQQVKSPDTKKVGKLKVGLNINVNALLPGASPKKVKPTDQTDGQTQSVVESQKEVQKVDPINVQSQKDFKNVEPVNVESQNPDSTLIKSVSFEGKPESGVLDNKISKERAKIQVKRRPSTRRARREAVRKSAIDFGEDSTDNSSSIDDPPRNVSGNKQPSKEIETTTIQDEKVDKHVESAEINTTKLKDTEVVTTQNVNLGKNAESTEIKTTKIKNNEVATTQDVNVGKKLELDKKVEPVLQDTQSKIVENIEKPTFSKDIKSKVVYILNDEDIFNTSPVQPTSSQKTENLDSNIGVTTISKVSKGSDDKNDGKSLFNDDDDEIFKTKVPVKKTAIFDSDSEDDLFGKRKGKKEKKVEKETKKEVVKGSLFGDDDDDDDLFGVKTKKVVEHNPHPTRSTVAKEPAKPTEPVFEDPLSMFGDDD